MNRIGMIIAAGISAIVAAAYLTYAVGLATPEMIDGDAEGRVRYRIAGIEFFEDDSDKRRLEREMIEEKFRDYPNVNPMWPLPKRNK